MRACSAASSQPSRRDKLAGSLQNSYGIAKDEAEKQIMDFEAKCERNQWVQ